MRRLILLRHGETDYNAARRMQGQLDTDLTATGVEQARAAAEELRGSGVSKIVSSDLTRARRTAEIVAGALGLEVTEDARLRETHLGAWQGLTHAEVDTTDGGIRTHWRNNPGWAPPEGESRLEVARRARPVVDELMQTYRGWGDSAVLLVAHGGTIAALTASLLGLAQDQYPLLKGLGNANAARLSALPADGEAQGVRWYLEAWNQGVSQ